MIRFESNRCLVRPFISSDIDSLMIYRNDLEWMKFQGFKGLSKEEYEDALIKESSLDEGMQLAIIEKISNEVIGDLYLKNTQESFWLGYTISPHYARKGYAYEVVLSFIEWAKEENIHLLSAGVLAENVASVKLLEKLGFKYLNTDEYGDAIYSMKI